MSAEQAARTRSEGSLPRLASLLLAVCALCVACLTFAASAGAIGGSAVGWGYNNEGAVGNGTAAPGNSCECIESPVAVSGPSDFTQISSGSYHTLGLRADGTVMAWGENNLGELGLGESTGPETCGSYACSKVPVQVPGLTGVVAVAAGDYHSLALRSDGTVWAWGDNEYSELGLGGSSGPESCGSEPCSMHPVQVPGLTDVVAIDASYYYNLALRGDGTVLFWGYNRYGESGDGVGTEAGCLCIDHPVPVPGLSGAVAISAGWYLSSALLADGTIKDWGYNEYGEVGNGTLNTENSPCYCVGPVAVSGIAGARGTASAGYHGIALSGSGSASAWGYNEKGEVGNGTKTSSGCECVPLPSPVSGGHTFREIAAEGYHTTALLTDGSAVSWGENGYGELGDGSTTDRPSPTPIAVAGASAVASGSNNGFAIIGPSQKLKVELVGAGAGAVGTDGLVCPAANCEADFSQGAVKILRPEALAGSAFAGFSGPCAGTGTCQLALTQDQTVTATFGVPKGTLITRAKISSKKKLAKLSFSAPGAITGYQCKLIRPRPKAHKKHTGKASAAKAKRKPAKFAGCATPRTYKHLRPGAYTFKVRALDILGADATPAVRHLKIKRVKLKKHGKRHHSR